MHHKSDSFFTFMAVLSKYVQENSSVCVQEKSSVYVQANTFVNPLISVAHSPWWLSQFGFLTGGKTGYVQILSVLPLMAKQNSYWSVDGNTYIISASLSKSAQHDKGHVLCLPLFSTQNESRNYSIITKSFTRNLLVINTEWTSDSFFTDVLHSSGTSVERSRVWGL